MLIIFSLTQNIPNYCYPSPSLLTPASSLVSCSSLGWNERIEISCCSSFLVLAFQFWTKLWTVLCRCSSTLWRNRRCSCFLEKSPWRCSFHCRSSVMETYLNQCWNVVRSKHFLVLTVNSQFYLIQIDIFAIYRLYTDKKRHYLAFQLSSFIHSNIILTLYTLDSQYASLRHTSDLQDACQTVRQLVKWVTLQDW